MEYYVHVNIVIHIPLQARLMAVCEMVTLFNLLIRVHREVFVVFFRGGQHENVN